MLTAAYQPVSPEQSKGWPTGEYVFRVATPAEIEEFIARVTK